jgi:hypothetical protein
LLHQVGQREEPVCHPKLAPVLPFLRPDSPLLHHAAGHRAASSRLSSSSPSPSAHVRSRPRGRPGNGGEDGRTWGQAVVDGATGEVSIQPILALYACFGAFDVLDGGTHNLLGPRVTLLLGTFIYPIYAGSFMAFVLLGAGFRGGRAQKGESTLISGFPLSSNAFCISRSYHVLDVIFGAHSAQRDAFCVLRLDVGDSSHINRSFLVELIGDLL